MRFKPGQKVVAAYKGTDPSATEHTYKPKLGEIVTVSGYSVYTDYLFLVEYSALIDGFYKPCYAESCFEPLMDISELTEIIETQTQEI